MKRFKTFLFEGWKQAKIQFVDTNKITKDEIIELMSICQRAQDTQGKFGEWICKWWTEHKKKEKKIVYIELKMISFLSDFKLWEFKKVVKGNPPLTKSMDDLRKWLDDIIEKHLSKKKVKISSSLKKGQDYEPVYHKGGIEIFKMISHEASKWFGKGTKWCISETEREHWNKYCFKEEMCFYYIRNHKYSTNNPKYKIVVTVDKNDSIYKVHDATDAEITISDLEQEKIPLKIFGYFEPYSKWKFSQLNDEYQIWGNQLRICHEDYVEQEKEYYQELIDEKIVPEIEKFKSIITKKENSVEENLERIEELGLDVETNPWDEQQHIYKEISDLKDKNEDIRSDIESFKNDIKNHEEYKEDPIRYAFENNIYFEYYDEYGDYLISDDHLRKFYEEHGLEQDTLDAANSVLYSGDESDYDNLVPSTLGIPDD